MKQNFFVLVFFTLSRFLSNNLPITKQFVNPVIRADNLTHISMSLHLPNSFLSHEGNLTAFFVAAFYFFSLSVHLELFTSYDRIQIFARILIEK